MEQRQKKATKQKQHSEPESLPNKNASKSNKDHKQKRPPPNSIPPPIQTDSESVTTQQTKLPFNVPNEVLNLSASENVSKKFAKRELIKNWDKYDEESNDTIDNNDQMNAADFSKLLAAPPSTVENHFFLNSEKNWHSNDESQQSSSSLAGKYFNLNIMELANNLQRLPFFIRQGYSEDLFSSKEIDEMKRKANLCEFKGGRSATTDKTDEIGSKMLDILSNRDESKTKAEENVVKQKKEVCHSPEKAISSSKSHSKECNEISLDNKQTETIIHQTGSDDDDELDQLLGLSLQSAPIKIGIAKVIQSSVPNVVEDDVNNVAISAAVGQNTAPKIGRTKEDIQKWLDDILD